MTSLEQRAIAAFHAGERWHNYVAEHREAIRTAEKGHPGTVQRLLHLLTTGEPSGMEPPAVGPAWGFDDDAGTEDGQGPPPLRFS